MSNHGSFEAVMPRLVQGAFAESNVQAMDFTDISQLLGTLGNVIKKVGITMHNVADMENPLDFMFQLRMPIGSIMEMISVQCQAPTDNRQFGEPTGNADPMAWYKPDTQALYSTLKVAIKQPITIGIEELSNFSSTPQQLGDFVSANMMAQRRAISNQRFLAAKELLNRVLTDNTLTSNVFTLNISEITDAQSCQVFWKTLNTIFNILKVDYSGLTKVGHIGNVSGSSMVDRIVVGPDGKLMFEKQIQEGIYMIIRGDWAAAAQSYLSGVYGPQFLVQNNVGIALTNNFGGISTSGGVTPTFSGSDGQVTNSNALIGDVDPHEDVVAMIVARDSVVASFDREVNVPIPDPSGAWTYHHTSVHTFAHVGYRPVAIIRKAIV